MSGGSISSLRGSGSLPPTHPLAPQPLLMPQSGLLCLLPGLIALPITFYFFAFLFSLYFHFFVFLFSFLATALWLQILASDFISLSLIFLSVKGGK